MAIKIQSIINKLSMVSRIISLESTFKNCSPKCWDWI